MDAPVVHAEPYSSPEGVDYIIEVVRGRSGRLYGRYTALRDHRTITCFPSRKTVRGAAGHAKRMISMNEDLDYDLED